MNHKEVVQRVSNWLKEQHASRDIEVGVRDIDLSVSTTEWVGNRTTIQTFLHVECKKTNDDMDRAIGQCLRYYASIPERSKELKGIPTYLAVPEDFQSLKELKYVIEFIDLPLGLLVVYYDGKVEELRKAIGKPAFFSIDIHFVANREEKKVA